MSLDNIKAANSPMPLKYDGVVESPICVVTALCQAFDVQQLLLQAWQSTKVCTLRALASQTIWDLFLSHIYGVKNICTRSN